MSGWLQAEMEARAEEEKARDIEQRLGQLQRDTKVTWSLKSCPFDN